MERIGIVIIGYKNTQGIERLLNSLSKVNFEGDRDITLIFSIDYSGDHSVEFIANAFQWEHGEKHVIAHRTNLGLRKHILSCGNYMEEYDLSAIAVFEDDIYVSPEMYRYMKNAVTFYKDNPKIAGISLYKHELNFNAKSTFVDYCDGGDTYFVQYAMSWGQVWLREQWKTFVRWYESEQWKKMDPDTIPANVRNWKNSWLKFHIMYCIDQDLYFVYPRTALSTNFSDIGTHNKTTITSVQVKLCMEKNSDWAFTHWGQTRAVYDAFFENKSLDAVLGFENLEIDLYGVKKYHEDTRYVLTRKCLPNKVIKSWGLFLRPIEANVFMDIPGEDIFLYDLAETDKAPVTIMHRYRCFEYELKGINILNLENVVFCLKKIIEYIKRKFAIIAISGRKKKK